MLFPPLPVHILSAQYWLHFHGCTATGCFDILPSSTSSPTQRGLTPTQIDQPPTSLAEDASPAVVDVLTVPDVASEYDIHISFWTSSGEERLRAWVTHLLRRWNTSSNSRNRTLEKDELNDDALDHSFACLSYQFKPCFVYNPGGPVTNQR